MSQCVIINILADMMQTVTVVKNLTDEELQQRIKSDEQALKKLQKEIVAEDPKMAIPVLQEINKGKLAQSNVLIHK